jgi:hypothetical protein
MQKTINVLAIVLAVQLVLAAVMAMTGGGLSAVGSGEPLIALDTDDLTAITIVGPDQEEVRLEKTEAGWVLPDLDGFPANEAKVQSFAAKLAGLKKRIPVATSAAAAERFQVAEEGFERRIELAHAGEESTVYLGDSPGMGRVYARAEGDDAVYEVALASYEAPADPDDWAATDRLRVPVEEVTRVGLGDLVLVKQDDAWTLEDLAEGESVDQDKAKDTVRRLASLSYLGVLGTAPEAAARLDAPALSAAMEWDDGKHRELALAAMSEGDGEDAGETSANANYILDASDLDHYFEVAPYVVQPLLEMDRKALLVAPEPQGPDEASDEASGEPEPVPPGSTDPAPEAQVGPPPGAAEPSP